ncbi:MAG: hypothetical protein JEY91_19070, partial [Spirochaetaceae bacterium]|nr:hypothetical protein [Spirochaetaceae bacterium]
MKNIKFKYHELLSKKNEVLDALDAGDEGVQLLYKFKEFCTICNSLKEWTDLSWSDLNSSVYIDICRGVSNGDKHYKIKYNLHTYKSGYY